MAVRDPKFTIEFEFRNTRFLSALQGMQHIGKKIEGGFARAATALSADMRGYLDAVALALAKRHSTPWPNGTTDKTLSMRSGNLIRAIKSSVAVKGTTVANLEGTIGAKVPYAAIQEFGGVIKPKTAKYLAIPLKAALDERGIPKKRSPREWEHTFVAMSKNGNLIIFQRRGTQIIPLYVLKSSVTIPARLGMRETIQSNMGFFVDRAMASMLKELRK